MSLGGQRIGRVSLLLSHGARCRQTEFGFGLWQAVVFVLVGPEKAIFFYHRNNSHDETTTLVQI